MPTKEMFSWSDQPAQILTDLRCFFPSQGSEKRIYFKPSIICFENFVLYIPQYYMNEHGAQSCKLHGVVVIGINLL